MPTFKPLILKHQQKEDGSFNVKIRITHNRESKYLATPLYIKGKQVSSKYEIRDRSVIRKIDDDIEAYWSIIKKATDITQLSVSELVELLEREKAKNQKVEIDFIEFARNYIDQLRQNDGDKYASSFNTTINSLCDYFGNEKILITEITAKSLDGYENYLRSDRTITRLNQFKKPVTTVHKGMGNGAQTYLTNIRTLFNEARFRYNDEDEGIINIPHYPFRKYKLAKKKSPQKRSLTPETVKAIIQFSEAKRTRASFGRDVFLISFYLIGTNLIDLYEATRIEKGRIMYNRSKTADRREDSAFISIKILHELKPLLEQYADPAGKRVFCFYKLYNTPENFLRAVNIGLKKVAEGVGVDKITTYFARHTWATIARNNSKVPKEDIILALNHVDHKHKVTDSYIETDWSIIDNANRKVLDMLKEKVLDDHQILMQDNEYVQRLIDEHNEQLRMA
jgi:integrase